MVLAWRSIAPGTGHEAGRELLAQLYRQHTGNPMPPVLITPMGKPYLENSPLHFSISHTKAHVFCSLSDHPIGIDAEELDRKIDLRLADKILSPTERVQYDAASDKRLALLKFWVLKEAAAKCSGEGLRVYPNQTKFSLDDPRVTQADGCLVAIIEEEHYAF